MGNKTGLMVTQIRVGKNQKPTIFPLKCKFRGIVKDKIRSCFFDMEGCNVGNILTTNVGVLLTWQLNVPSDLHHPVIPANAEIH